MSEEIDVNQEIVAMMMSPSGDFGDYSTLNDPFRAKLPPGMNPLGQSADRKWNSYSWYETGAMCEAVIDLFPPASTILDRTLEYVIGDGFNINPNTGDQKLDDDLEQYYLDIVNKSEIIDYDCESNLMDVCRKMLRGALVPGGHFANFISREETGTVGKVQLIEAYRCKTPYNMSVNNLDRTVGGIRLANHSRKQIGYWFEQDDVGDWGQFLTSTSDKMSYIDAEDEEGNKQCIHFRLQGRASSTKSEGVMSVAIKTIFQYIRLRECVLTKAEIANAITLVKEVDPKSPNFIELAKTVNERLLKNGEFGKGFEVRPGQTIVAPGGMTTRMETPNVPNQEYFTLEEILFRELGGLFWISKELAQLNASTSNYSSIRMLMKAAEPGLKKLQRLLAYGFLRHWWSFIVRDISYTDAAIRRAIARQKYNPHCAAWDYPGWKGLDPKVDFESDNDRMSNGHASDSSVFQERGLNFSKEKPRIVADAKWGLELVLQEVLDPAFRKLYEEAGWTPREVTALLYGRTSPNGQKILQSITAAKEEKKEDKDAANAKSENA